ncbi:Alpha/Beta hydrolase protein [Truncatella angustata]|uniref:Alpha/Beta hydrolase protein n=1 Tax=Truncatella angustata TaxID=152316 RepID=A0A9P8USV7_9PEZI|nr:Alpha/Beta hydrolase protein [Truncatella angustata]KAH6657594.1 Alpha/Beta hydrolase protein [Truncatella angustata]
MGSLIRAIYPTIHNTTQNLTYEGLERNGIEVFLDIPYGQDTSGALVPSSGTAINAQTYGAACPHELKITPDDLILQIFETGAPVIQVAMNYSLGVFGFAQSEALKLEVAQNAGLRDQRLVIEWVRDNIAHFGGNPDRITIFGQQIMAYGLSLEPGITGNFTLKTMEAVIKARGCEGSGLDSPKTVVCLRDLDVDILLNAFLATYQCDIGHKHRGHMAAYDGPISTPNDTRSFISSYLPAISSSHVNELLVLCPISEFAAIPASRRGTMLDPFLVEAGGAAGMGMIHTSEFAYIFGNLTHYNASGYPFDPMPQDWALEQKASRSWVVGIRDGYDHDEVRIFVVGGPEEGSSAIDGPAAESALARQRLRERSAFANSPEIVEELCY